MSVVAILAATPLATVAVAGFVLGVIVTCLALLAAMAVWG